MRAVYKTIAKMLENREVLADFLPDGFKYKELEDAFTVEGHRVFVSVYNDSVVINDIASISSRSSFSWTWLPKYGILHIDLFYPQSSFQKMPATMFKKQLPVLKKLEINEIRLEAIKDGRYVWAIYGFNSEDRNNMFAHMKRLYAPDEKIVIIPHMNTLACYVVKESELGKLQDLTYVKKQVPSTYLENTSYLDESGNFKLGKYYLLHDAPNWDGRLRLWSGLDYQILMKRLS